MSYRALVDLFYPTDTSIVRRLADGENLPMRGRGMKHVPAGTVVDDIPAVSIPVLLAKGKIERVEPVAARMTLRNPKPAETEEA